MKARTIALTVAVCFVGLTLCFSSPMMGTWKLNEAKSKFGPGAPKNNTVVYEASGDNIKITVDGVDAEGKPTHNEWTGKFDGKDYPVTGDAWSDSRSYKKVNGNTLDSTNKKEGKPTLHAHIVVSADGKTRTVTLHGSVNGKKITETAVYDKQ